MRSGDFPDMVDLLPHAAPMVLLDSIVALDDTGLTASVTVRPDTRFACPGEGVPAHIGVEWMAQACGAFAGARAKASGSPIRLGYLLGTRDFQADRAWFAMVEVFLVSASQIFHEDGMAVFDCRIDCGPVNCARARLTVFQPSGSDNGEATT